MPSGWFCSTGSCESKSVVRMSRVRVGLHPLGSKDIWQLGRVTFLKLASQLAISQSRPKASVVAEHMAGLTSVWLGQLPGTFRQCNSSIMTMQLHLGIVAAFLFLSYKCLFNIIIVMCVKKGNNDPNGGTSISFRHNFYGRAD